MNQFEMDLKTSEGREWLAMQFVLGELSDDLADQFQDALSEDLELCELVGQSVQLISGLAASHPVKTSPRPVQATLIHANAGEHDAATFDRLPNRFRSWQVKTALFAAVLFALAIARPTPTTKFEVRNSSDVFGSLDELESAALSFDGNSVDDELVADAENDGRLSVLDAPEWLVTAVELEQMTEAGHDEDEDLGVF